MGNTAKFITSETMDLDKQLTPEQLNTLNTVGYIWYDAGEFTLKDKKTGDTLEIVAQWEHYKFNSLGCHAYIAGRLSYRPKDKAVMRDKDGRLHNVNGFGQYSNTGAADAKKRLTNWAAFGIDEKGNNKPFPDGVLEPIFSKMAAFYDSATHVVMSSPVNYSFRKTSDRQGVEMPYNPNGNIAQFAAWLVKNRRGMLISSPISNNHIYSYAPRLIRTWLYIPKRACEVSVEDSHVVFNDDLIPSQAQAQSNLRQRGASNYKIEFDRIFGEEF